jgi:hypothetical protein
VAQNSREAEAEGDAPVRYRASVMSALHVSGMMNGVRFVDCGE